MLRLVIFNIFWRFEPKWKTLSEIKPPLAIKERKKGNLWVQLNDFSFPSYFLTFSLFIYSDAAFTNGNTVHPNPVSFHDKVTNMEALIRSLKTYYEVKIDYYWKKNLRKCYIIKITERSKYMSNFSWTYIES